MSVSINVLEIQHIGTFTDSGEQGISNIDWEDETFVFQTCYF